jgi:hypothetical protein
VARNAFDNMPTEPQFGGLFGDRTPSKHVKFPEEARTCLGCAMLTNFNEDGTSTNIGVKMPPFNYTGRLVVGISGFKIVRSHLWAEPDGIIKIEQVLRVVNNLQDEVALNALIEEGVNGVEEDEE